MTSNNDTRPHLRTHDEMPGGFCSSCGKFVFSQCGECDESVCSVCFRNIHLQATGCFGVFDNDAQPSWFGLASGLARRQG